MIDKKHALTVLNRLAARRSDQEERLIEALRGRVDELTDLTVDVAIETGDPIGTILSGLVWESDQVSVEQLAERLDDNASSVPLRELAVAATHKLIENRLAQWKSPDEQQRAELARLYRNLSVRLEASGLMTDAREAASRSNYWNPYRISIRSSTCLILPLRGRTSETPSESWGS